MRTGMNQAVAGKASPGLLNLLVRKATIVFERINGLDFSSVTHPHKLGLDPALAFRSSPSGNKYLSRMLADLPIDAADTILDIGCGKGSALRGMLAFAFRAVDGLELSEQLAAIARKNFAQLGETRSTIFAGDAARFDGYAAYSYYYMYNPFPAVVMQPVLAAIAAQGAGAAERILIYNNPTCHAEVEAAGWTLMREYPDQWGNGIHVYSNRPQGSRLA